MVNESKYDIGDELKDSVSGFIGIVMAITFYSTGCTHYALASKNLKEGGGVADWEHFDQSRLTRIQEKAVSFNVNDEKPSGAFQNPPQH